MTGKWLALAAVAAGAATVDLVTEVRSLVARGDFAQAEKRIAERRGGAERVEVAEAVSWLGRGALAAGRYDLAAARAAEARQLSLDLLRSRQLDDEKHLPLALGASIEVHAQVLAATGHRGEAVDFLRGELKTWGGTSIYERIQKNINLLSLEGKPAPPLTASTWLAGKPRTLASLRGHPTLLFLWAHWCADCKGMAAPLAELLKTYAPRGLEIVGPTRLYGDAAGGMDAPPDQELKYIEQVRRASYAPLGDMPVPVGNEIFRTYGVSTTPTLVLIDRSGVVRLYHPGAMTQTELHSRIEPLLTR